MDADDYYRYDIVSQMSSFCGRILSASALLIRMNSFMVSALKLTSILFAEFVEMMTKK